MWLLGMHHVVNRANGLLQDLLVEKHDGTQCLALGGGSDTTFHGQLG